MMTRKKEVAPPSPGSVADTLIKKFGNFWGEVSLRALSGIFAIVLLIFMLLILFCFLVLVDSLRYILSENFPPFNELLGVIFTFGMIFILIFVRANKNKDFDTSLKRYFSFQTTITGMVFAQTFIWMLDSTDSTYEPRVAFFGVMVLFLAYFRDRFTAFIGRLIALGDQHREELSTEKSGSLPSEKNDFAVEELWRFYDLEEHPQGSKSSRET